MTLPDAPPADWAALFEAAHLFAPPFTAAEMSAPWCRGCCDFHLPAEEHSYVEGQLPPD